RDWLDSLVPPFIFEGRIPAPDTWERRDAPSELTKVGASLTGIGGCPGVARGRARVVLDPLDPRGLAPGDVLVAPITDPSWTPLFVPAEAVVVDVDTVTVGARRPRGNLEWPEVGILAQRAKARPSRIGVSVCELVEVDGLELAVRGLDAIDGTPVLDVKPYMIEFAPRGPIFQ